MKRKTDDDVCEPVSPLIIIALVSSSSRGERGRGLMNILRFRSSLTKRLKIEVVFSKNWNDDDDDVQYKGKIEKFRFSPL